MAVRLAKYGVVALILFTLVIATFIVALYNGQAPPEAEVIPKFDEANGKSETNGIDMKLVLIPAGKFMMGNRVAQGDEESFLAKYAVYPNAVPLQFEYPAHEVQISKRFWMGAHHVTRTQFSKFVADTGYETDAETDSAPWAWGADVEKGEFAGSQPNRSWRNVGFPQAEDHPVVNVSWNDAKAFCAWLSKREGAIYRLPTEAEWEYACRARTVSRFWCGNSCDTLFRVANVADDEFHKVFPKVAVRSCGSDGFAFTSPVGSFYANPFGLFDMHGNANQWCEDRGRTYSDEAVVDPVGDLTASHGYRGGSWRLSAIECRCSSRIVLVSPLMRDDGLGFRVVREYDTAKK